MPIPVKADWDPAKHPHVCYSTWARAGLAVLGSIPPLGVMALTSKMPTRIASVAPELSTSVLLLAVTIFTTWLVGIIRTARAEQKDLLDYAVLGGVYPANTFLVLYATQAVLA